MNYIILSYIAFCLTLAYDLFGLMHQPAFNRSMTSLADTAFDIHSLLLASCLFKAVMSMPRSINQIHLLAILISISIVMAIAVMAVIDTVLAIKLTVLAAYALGLLKYVPQIKLNINRRSTDGFSIGAVYCDIAGQLLNFGAVVLNRLNSDSPTDEFNQLLEMIKYVLAIVQISMCSVFLLQHYILFISRETQNEPSVNTSDDSLIQSSKRLQNSMHQLKDDCSG